MEKIVQCFKSFVVFAGILTAITGIATNPASAQEKSNTVQQSGTPGFVTPGTRPGKGLAPGMKVADLGKGGRTFRVNFVKGDEIMSGLTEFAEKYRIRNGHFTAIGAIGKGLFGWANPEQRERGQKKIELNEEAEIVSFMGNIYVDDKGRSVVHGHGSVALSDGTVKGGHWWEAHVSIVAIVFVTEEEDASAATK